MRKYKVFSLLCLALSVLVNTISCTVAKTETLVIKPVLTSTKAPLGNGIHMLIPLDYQEATQGPNSSATTFEAMGGASFIKAMTSSTSVEVLKGDYNDVQELEAKGLSLIEMSNVRYGDIEDAFFVKVYEESSNLFHYLLAIHKTGITYQLSAACSDISHDAYDYKIRQAMLSVFIANPVD